MTFNNITSDFEKVIYSNKCRDLLIQELPVSVKGRNIRNY